MSNTGYGYIYLILLREFKRSKESVVKLGRTNSVPTRMMDYPKGSRLLFATFVGNMKEAEADLLQQFRDKYVSRRDIGREYFEGEYMRMLTDVTQYALNQKQLDIFEEVEVNENEKKDRKHDTKTGKKDTNEIQPQPKPVPVPEPPKKQEPNTIKDPDLIIKEFMDMKKTTYNGRCVKSVEVYQDFCKWKDENFERVDGRYITHAKLSRVLVNGYGVQSRTHRFEDGVAQALCFGDLATSQQEIEDACIKFIAHHIVTGDETDWFTAAQAKELFFKRGFHNGSVIILQAFNEELRKRAGVPCFESKRIGCYNHYNVYCGLRLVDADHTGNDLFDIPELDKEQSLHIVHKWMANRVHVTNEQGDRVSITLLYDEFKKDTGLKYNSVTLGKLFSRLGFKSRANNMARYIFGVKLLDR